MCRCMENGTFYEGSWYVLRQNAHENKTLITGADGLAREKETYFRSDIGVPMYRFPDVPRYGFTDVPIYRCIDVSMYRKWYVL